LTAFPSAFGSKGVAQTAHQWSLCCLIFVAHHELPAYHGALLVSNGLAVVVHLQTLDCIVVSHVAVVLLRSFVSGLLEPLERCSMFILLLSPACFMYSHPVFLVSLHTLILSDFLFLLDSVLDYFPHTNFVTTTIKN